MTFSTRFTHAPAVTVVVLMTVIAFGRQCGLVGILGVTGVTRQLAMTPGEVEIRIGIVIERTADPILFVVAHVAPESIAVIVDIVGLMAINARP